jgi:hypothetical protein
MKHPFALRDASLLAVAAIGLGTGLSGPQAAVAAEAGTYVTGDFHNHTTCSDGQISMQKLVNRSVDVYGLDWFVMAGHGGGGTRNCTLVDDASVATPPSNPYVPGMGPSTSWADSIGIERIKGDRQAEGYMFRWQSIQEFQYPILEQMAAAKSKPIFIGLESVAPGHEHTDVAIIDGQLPPGGGAGNATAMAMYEYCFDRADGDLSQGGGQGWDCTVPGGALNDKLDPRGRKLAGSYNSGTLGHQKNLEALKWQAAYYPNTSFHIPAHLERAGAFNPNGNNGFNIEHLRDFNNTAPTVAFGMEGGPGHQANGNRSYGSGAVGGGTYGGAGFYTAQVGGVWDALLGEGRNWFIFNNSDYHNRGSFGPDDRASTSDHYPGEFNKTYVLAKTEGGPLTPQVIVDGMRSGNAYYVNGDLIDKFSFVVCKAQGNSSGNGKHPHEQQIAAAAAAGAGFINPNCAQQGEKLQVEPGQELLVMVVLRDPGGENLSPYSFANPSLLQVGINQPLNQPVLDHVDLIGGRVTGYVDPSDTARYAGLINSPAATNPSTAIMATFDKSNWTAESDGWKRMFYRVKSVQDSQYLRLRGTNMPHAVPNETDSQGNPLIDSLANNIVCADANCPAHLPAVTGGRRLDYDVEAWTDLWFYSNPVYIEVQGSTPVAGIKDAGGRKGKGDLQAGKGDDATRGRLLSALR